jgi:hypothetical protein
MHYSSSLGGTSTDSSKSAGTRYAELVLLLLRGSVGHIVHSSGSGA